jgi:diketogulonate reductase-like aldo/keto reductase
VRVPQILYGTAWKEARTEELTRLALDAGFRAIDTANQRKHYHEAGVGAALAASGVPRDELFLQTKYTYANGQDDRIPYDRAAPIATQVQESFASSCEHLGVEVIDSYVLHGPMWNRGWGPEDEEAWSAMEALATARRVRSLGVSNVALDQLTALCRTASIAPAFVQNRCFARTGWDRAVRDVCRERGIVYQGFSLLTANARELSSPEVAAIAKRAGATVPQLVFAWARSVGMLPLTGTTSRRHMDEDLASLSLEIDAADLALFERATTARSQR